MSELSLSLTFAALSTALITMGLSFTSGLFNDNAQIAEFAGTVFGASWLVLAQAKLWEGRTFDVGMRRASLVITGAAIGSLAYWLHHVLVVDLPTTGSIDAAFANIGMHSLIEANTKDRALAHRIHRLFRVLDGTSPLVAAGGLVPQQPPGDLVHPSDGGLGLRAHGHLLVPDHLGNSVRRGDLRHGAVGRRLGSAQRTGGVDGGWQPCVAQITSRCCCRIPIGPSLNFSIKEYRQCFS